MAATQISKTVLTPTQRKRMAVYEKMTPKGKELADDMLVLVGKQESGSILLHYTMGARIREALNDTSNYGVGYADELAKYLNLSGGRNALYNMKNFAGTFKRELVIEWSRKPLPDASYMNIRHWYVLAQVSDPATQLALLDDTVRKGLSAAALRQQILGSGTPLKNARYGGRKGGVPSSPAAGLRQCLETAGKLSRLGANMDRYILTPISKMAPDSVSPQLLEILEKTREKVGEARAATEGMITGIDGDIVRVKAVLKARKGKPTARTSSNGRPRGKSGRRAKRRAGASARPQPAALV